MLVRNAMVPHIEGEVLSLAISFHLENENPNNQGEKLSPEEQYICFPFFK